MTIPTVDWSKIEWQKVREGVDRKAFSGASATLALHRLQPGHEPRPHQHSYEQIVYILQGAVDFHVGGEVIRLGPGGLLTVPPDVMHHAEVVGSETVLNLDVFTPRRPDYA
jgi:quercetin dioxygenase-like cupin family protein